MVKKATYFVLKWLKNRGAVIFFADYSGQRLSAHADKSGNELIFYMDFLHWRYR